MGRNQLSAVVGLDRPTRTALQDISRRLATLEPEPWTAVTFQNGWSNYGGGWQPVQYRKVGDIVTIRGLALSGTVTPATVIFNLPVGYRPQTPHLQGTDGGSILGRFDVQINGNVVWQIGAGTGAYFSMNAQFSVTA